MIRSRPHQSNKTSPPDRTRAVTYAGRSGLALEYWENEGGQLANAVNTSVALIPLGSPMVRLKPLPGGRENGRRFGFRPWARMPPL
jgi:hypothetical protein